MTNGATSIIARVFISRVSLAADGTLHCHPAVDLDAAAISAVSAHARPARPPPPDLGLSFDQTLN